MFVDRSDELTMLAQLLHRQRGGELLLLYGRRRVGKTALLRAWASQSGIPWTYWMAQKEPAVLQELRLVERRVPATVPPALQHRSKQGRYHLIDPFHRFSFRFLRPNQAEIAYQPDRVLELIQAGLRAFVGQTAWEGLARTWVWLQGLRGALGFTPEVIGSHWDRSVQADVVAVSCWTRYVPARASKHVLEPHILVDKLLGSLEAER